MYFIVFAIISNAVWAVVAWTINKRWSDFCKLVEDEMYIWKARALMRGEEDEE